MTARILTVLFFSLAISAAIAQTEPSAAENPPDQQAYLDANKISDPEKKIAALEKLKTDFPDSIVCLPRRFADSEHARPEDAGTDRSAFAKRPKRCTRQSVARDKAASKENTFVTTANRGSAATRHRRPVG